MTQIKLDACTNLGFSHYAHWEDDDSRYHVWMARDHRDSVVHINSATPNGKDHHTRKLSAKAQAWILPLLDTLTPADFDAADYRASAEGKANAEALRVENLTLTAQRLHDDLAKGEPAAASDDLAILLHRLAAKLGYSVTALPPAPEPYQDADSILEAMADHGGPLQRFDVIVTRDATVSQSVTVWAADESDATATATDLADNRPDAWAMDDDSFWQSDSYTNGADPAPHFVADFDPLAKGSALGLFREEFDSGDPWGSAMSFAFDVAGALDMRGEDVPPELSYSPGAGGAHVGEDRVETMAALGTDSLVYAARVLSRYLDACHRAGLNY